MTLTDYVERVRALESRLEMAVGPDLAPDWIARQWYLSEPVRKAEAEGRQVPPALLTDLYQALAELEARVEDLIELRRHPWRWRWRRWCARAF